MTATDIAAWYAAIVATVAFGWDMIKWFRSGPRLLIRATPNTCYEDSRVIGESTLESGVKVTDLEEYYHIEISNVGLQPTTLIGISLISKSKKRQRSYSANSFVAHRGSKPFPTLLSPGETWSARIEMTRVETLATLAKPTLCVRASYKEKAILKTIKIKPKTGVSAD